MSGKSSSKRLLRWARAIRMRRLIILIIPIVLIFCVHGVRGQGSSGYGFSSARILGLGGAYIGMADDASSALFNPAGLPGLKRSAVIASYGLKFRGLQDGNLQDGALVYSKDFGLRNAFGVGISMSMAESYNETKLSLSLARKMWLLGEEGRWILSAGCI